MGRSFVTFIDILLTTYPISIYISCTFTSILCMYFRCKGLILLETYSTLSGDELKNRLPEFLGICKEVTGDPRYSMFNLSLKERWANNTNFCENLAGTGNAYH